MCVCVCVWLYVYEYMRMCERETLSFPKRREPVPFVCVRSYTEMRREKERGRVCEKEVLSVCVCVCLDVCMKGS